MSRGLFSALVFNHITEDAGQQYLFSWVPRLSQKRTPLHPLPSNLNLVDFFPNVA
jgi:hypothetical protein